MNKNIAIVYDSLEEELNATYYEPADKTNWSFNLYKTTDEMVAAGKALHNSLACQRGLAIEKDATFLYVKNEYNQIIGCVSLKRQDDRFIVWEFQFLADIEPKLNSVTLKWLTDHNINCNGPVCLRKVRGTTYGKHIIAA